MPKISEIGALLGGLAALIGAAVTVISYYEPQEPHPDKSPKLEFEADIDSFGMVGKMTAFLDKNTGNDVFLNLALDTPIFAIGDEGDCASSDEFGDGCLKMYNSGSIKNGRVYGVEPDRIDTRTAIELRYPSGAADKFSHSGGRWYFQGHFYVKGYVAGDRETTLYSLDYPKH